MEGLKVSKTNLIVYIHPSKANKVPEAMKRELSTLLFKFSEVFDGVVLSYDVSIKNEDAKILSGIHPYFGVRLTANLLLFSPKPDMLVEGKVVKIGKESIHIIVLAFSSAAIMQEDIREEFRYKIKHGKEVFASRSHKRHVIKVGSTIRFLVKSFDEEILHISGSLIPSHTGNIEWLDKYTEESSQQERSIKGENETDKGKVKLDLGVYKEGAILNSDHRRSKKSKRRRPEEES